MKKETNETLSNESPVNKKSGCEKLKELVRFEIEPSIFSTEKDSYFEENEIAGSYKPTYQDLVVACENMIKDDVDFTIFENWYYYVSEELEDHYEGVWVTEPDLGYLWPNNDYDQFKAMDFALGTMDERVNFYGTAGSLKEGLQEIVRMAENYQFNREHDITEWKLTESQRFEILDRFAVSVDKVSDSRRELFRHIVDEECEKENCIAMRIKGYGCYGGNKVFECDWEESRKWITKLFEIEGGPYLANTLGYIYYYGRCSRGIPDYEKAFQYFSIGAAHNVIESMYKIADMFLSGKGCIKAPKTADHIVRELYEDSLPRFLAGEDAKFADVALRMAAVFQRIDQYESALYHYLEADFAIKKRLKKSDFFGDQTVQEKIRKSIEEVKTHLNPGFFKEELVVKYPYWLFSMVDYDCNAKIEIVPIEDNRYKITVIRPKKNHAGKVLVVSNELEKVALTRSFESEFVTKNPITYLCPDKSNMYVNNIKYTDENEYSFCNGDKVIFIIRDAEYILRKKDFDLSGKASKSRQ